MGRAKPRKDAVNPTDLSARAITLFLKPESVLSSSPASSTLKKRLVYEYRLTYDTGRKENRAQKKAEYGFQKRKIAAQSHNQADHRSTYIT